MYYTPSGIFSQSYLSRTIEIVGAERIMFSQDWPYQASSQGGARVFFDQAALPQASKEGIAHGTWEKLVGAIRRS